MKLSSMVISQEGRSVPERIGVLCVDDNRFVAEAIQEQLSSDEGFTWLGHQLDAEDLLSHVQRLKPDVVLLDIDMPGPNPFEALQEVSEQCPDVAVLILSGYVKPELIDRAIDAGASGYLSKGDDAETLLADIQRAAHGEFVLGNISASPRSH